MATDVQQAPSGWVRRIVVGRDPRRTLVRIIFWVAICLLLRQFVFLPIRVYGISMMPTYQERSVHFVSRIAYLFHGPRRGDVVAVKLAGERVMYMKRILALPRETLEFRDGHALINGHVLDEPYLKYPCNWEHSPEKIGVDEYYLVGDNRSMDFTEHTQGKAWRSQIVGKVIL